MLKTILTLNFLLLLSLNIFGQVKEISKEEYYQSFRTSLQKGDETSRRVVAEQKTYRDGNKFTTIKYLDEYLMPDRRYHLTEEIFPDKTQKVELIQIGEIYYCRRNDENWKQSGNWCADSSAFGLPNTITTKFTVEEVKVKNETLKLYEQYITYKNIYSPTKDKEGLSYWQTKFWINKIGLIVREELENGLLEPSRIRWTQFKTYEYNPKDLKIEAPIK